jgi:hypothetical protein
MIVNIFSRVSFTPKQTGCYVVSIWFTNPQSVLPFIIIARPSNRYSSCSIFTGCVSFCVLYVSMDHKLYIYRVYGNFYSNFYRCFGILPVTSHPEDKSLPVFTPLMSVHGIGYLLVLFILFLRLFFPEVDRPSAFRICFHLSFLLRVFFVIVPSTLGCWRGLFTLIMRKFKEFDEITGFKSSKIHTAVVYLTIFTCMLQLRSLYIYIFNMEKNTENHIFIVLYCIHLFICFSNESIICQTVLEIRRRMEFVNNRLQKVIVESKTPGIGCERPIGMFLCWNKVVMVNYSSNC